MSNSLQKYPFLIFKGVLLILIAAIPYSRALISISVALLFISALTEFIVNKPKSSLSNLYFVFLILLVGLCILDVYRANNMEEWVSSIEIKLALVILPFAILVFKNKLTSDFLKIISIVFCVSISFSTLASMINYWLHFEEINQLVLQSKNVPIIGGMHHITYSVYCAFAVILSAVLAYSGKRWLWLLSVINFIGLHILTARTGLVGFYFTCIILGLVYILNHKPNTKILISGIAAILFIPIAAYFGIGSFHNRVLNTIADIKVIQHQTDVNYQSMGMRVEASKTAYGIIKKNPIFGVGCSNIKEYMAAQYEINNTNLFLENRILPHNQFIMETTVHGIIGLLVLLAFFLLPLFNPLQKLPLLFISLWSLCFFACMFECLFDRQHGIILVSLFWFIYLDYRPEVIKSSESANF